MLPFLLLAVLAAAQIGVAGAALWSAGVAARAGARAALVGGDAAPAREASAAGRPAPGGRGGAKAMRSRSGSPIPRLLPMMPVLRVGAKAALESGDGQ